ncbi:hypothetical protein KGM_213175 [Danaus plexippus plexippus]|uniref:Peptidase S1 domain-containing protein n=1 Tax=Danaus plexippus plexippus TaxID=278856 RepID=A0A212FIR3_DANPL|nr:hypothetical protein KGM_213175 [Danaus plexippus plexippus]
MMNRINIFLIIFTLSNHLSGLFGRIIWEDIRCSSDREQAVPEGKLMDIGRFPWIGVVQHSFYLGGKTRFAVTSAVLVHPKYAIASAEDISRIDPDTLLNNTKFILWQSTSNKFSMNVEEYYLPSEFTEGVTLASIAMLLLHIDGIGGTVAPVLPICMPIPGTMHTYDNLYAIRMNEDDGEIQKEVHNMHYVVNQECEEFYYKNKLNYKKMSPSSSICAATGEQQTCVWDAGVALITRQPWGYWKLLGFSVRGPGCSAPARFLPIQHYLSWLEGIIINVDRRSNNEDKILTFRRVSPIELIMYEGKILQPKEFGICERKIRGNVVYKDSTELLINKNFAQGFFFLSVAQVVEVLCVTIILEVSARTNAAIWMEHHCHRGLLGDSMKSTTFKDYSARQCFVYFKTEAYVEFRFYFSFKASLEVTLYGKEESPKIIPKPWVSLENTYPWRPTYDYFRQASFMPHYAWWWSM